MGIKVNVIVRCLQHAAETKRGLGILSVSDSLTRGLQKKHTSVCSGSH